MANWGNYILSVAVSFFMMPFIIYHLGDVRYGIWVLVISLTGYLGLLDLGIGGSVIKYVAQFESQKDQKRMNSMSSSVFYLYSGIAIVIILISICIATYALQYFRIPDEYLAVAKYVAIITGMNIALSFPFGFYGGYLRGIQRYDLIALLDTMVLLFRTLLTVFCLLYTSDAADDLLCVDLGGRRIIKKKKKKNTLTTYLAASYTTAYTLNTICNTRLAEFTTPLYLISQRISSPNNTPQH